MFFSFKKITPTSQILESFHNLIKKKRKTNDLSFGIKIMESIFLIKKKLQDES